MSITSALLSKLSKRGILSAQKLQKLPSPPPEEDKAPLIVDFCPNKYNIYHECTAWCQTHWKGFASPAPRYAKNMKVALSKYPLPPKWLEVFEKGVGCYYYWNTETEQVSWLPPNHPKAIIGECAAKLRIKRLKEEHAAKLADVPLPPQNAPEPHRDLINKSISSSSKEKERSSSDRRKAAHKNWHKSEDKNRREHSSSHHRKRSRRDDLDPMDPAAYSDIPRGSWSDGLEVSKGKADSTASGALFQQRPYPTPGEVLAANKNRK